MRIEQVQFEAAGARFDPGRQSEHDRERMRSSTCPGIRWAGVNVGPVLRGARLADHKKSIPFKLTIPVWGKCELGVIAVRDADLPKWANSWNCGKRRGNGAEPGEREKFGEATAGREPAILRESHMEVSMRAPRPWQAESAEGGGQRSESGARRRMGRMGQDGERKCFPRPSGGGKVVHGGHLKVELQTLSTHHRGWAMSARLATLRRRWNCRKRSHKAQKNALPRTWIEGWRALVTSCPTTPREASPPEGGTPNLTCL